MEGVLTFWKHAADEFNRPWHTAEAVAALIEHDPGALILAIDGDRLVGSVISGWDGWRGHIYRLAVQSSYRRMGLGRRLLQAAEERLRAKGCLRVDAAVYDENERAHGLWETAGYQRQARWSRWVKQLDD